MHFQLYFIFFVFLELKLFNNFLLFASLKFNFFLRFVLYLKLSHMIIITRLRLLELLTLQYGVAAIKLHGHDQLPY